MTDGTAEPSAPWVVPSREAGIALAVPVDVAIDADALALDLDRVEASVPREQRTIAHVDDGWCVIPLIDRGRGGGTIRHPALDHMPAASALLERLDLSLTRVYLTRFPVGQVLDWHLDPVGPESAELRLIIPIRTDAGARLLIGHETHHFPAGQCWAADFTFPHRLENLGRVDRIALTVNARMDERARRLLPPDFLARGGERRDLAARMAALMQAWWDAGLVGCGPVGHGPA